MNPRRSHSLEDIRSWTPFEHEEDNVNDEEEEDESQVLYLTVEETELIRWISSYCRHYENLYYIYVESNSNPQKDGYHLDVPISHLIMYYWTLQISNNNNVSYVFLNTQATPLDPRQWSLGDLILALTPFIQTRHLYQSKTVEKGFYLIFDYRVPDWIITQGEKIDGLLQDIDELDTIFRRFLFTRERNNNNNNKTTLI